MLVFVISLYLTRPRDIKQDCREKKENGHNRCPISLLNYLSYRIDIPVFVQSPYGPLAACPPVVVTIGIPRCSIDHPRRARWHMTTRELIGVSWICLHPAAVLPDPFISSTVIHLFIVSTLSFRPIHWIHHDYQPACERFVSSDQTLFGP